MAAHKDPLSSIVGDDLRVKLLRIFALNKETVYIPKEFVKTLRKREHSIKDALKKIEKDGIVKKKKISQAEQKSRDIQETVGFGFNKRYAHRVFLEKIIRESVPTERDSLAKKISRVPGVQCVITTDIFVEEPIARIDLVVASSEDNELLLKELVRNSERAIGRELRCAFLTVNDLAHRIRVNDKFIRDILESEYRVHIDRAGVFGE